MTSGTRSTRAVDELAWLLRPVRRAFSTKLPEIVVGFAVLFTVLAALAVAGAVLDDRAIAANPAIAQADVLEGSSFMRTLVRFTVANGEAVVPEHGVLYPWGLQVGQSVPVEYDVTDPELARVAGSNGPNSAGPLLGALAVVWAAAVPLSRWLRRRRSAARPPVEDGVQSPRDRDDECVGR